MYVRKHLYRLTEPLNQIQPPSLTSIKYQVPEVKLLVYYNLTNNEQNNNNNTKHVCRVNI